MEAALCCVHNLEGNKTQESNSNRTPTDRGVVWNTGADMYLWQGLVYLVKGSPSLSSWDACLLWFLTVLAFEV